MTKLVLLPGMDGTGELFAPFCAAIGGNTQVVRYPESSAFTYEELETLVLAELPTHGPYVLLGESFSGPIAISIAAKRPRMLRGVVLCCSFSKNPRPGLRLLRGLVNLLPVKPPVAVLARVLAGRFATPSLQEALLRALAQASTRAFRARMTAVIGVDVVPALRAIAVPLLYLRASEDRVVPPGAADLILKEMPSARVTDLVAPHFLLQTVPTEAAALVTRFMQEVENGP